MDDVIMVINSVHRMMPVVGGYRRARTEKDVTFIYSQSLGRCFGLQHLSQLKGRCIQGQTNGKMKTSTPPWPDRLDQMLRVEIKKVMVL